MAPKRKEVATAPLPPNKQNGGSGRGQGRKAKGVNTPGVDDPALPRKVQKTMADLLGARFAKKPAEPAVAGAVEPAQADNAPTLEWDYVRHDGDEEDTMVPQQQRPGGRVQYDLEKDALGGAFLISRNLDGPAVRAGQAGRKNKK
jgi:hypothetical protein